MARTLRYGETAEEPESYFATPDTRDFVSVATFLLKLNPVHSYL